MPEPKAGRRSRGALLPPDPQFPQRDRLLDPEAVGPRLAELPGATGLEGCQRHSVRYRPLKYLQAVYRLGTGEGNKLVSVHAYPPGESGSAYRQALDACLAKNSADAVGHLPELDAVAWFFPHDRAIVGLGALADPPSDLRSLLPGWRASTFHTYLAARSAVAACLDIDGRIIGFAKAYADDLGARTHEVMEELSAQRGRADMGVRTPDALAYSPSRRILISEAMPGRPLRELEGADLVAGCRRLGAALAALHSAKVAGLMTSAHHAPARLRAAAQTIAFVLPPNDPALDRLIEQLENSRSSGETPPALLHGDVKMPNAIIDGDEVAIIDFDTARLGPAESDLGHFLGFLAAEVWTGRRATTEATMMAGAFLDGYVGAGRGFDPAALNWHAGASIIVKRIARSVKNVRPGAVKRIPGMLAGTAAILEGHGFWANGGL